MKKQWYIRLSATFTSVLLAIVFVAYLLCGPIVFELGVPEQLCQYFFSCSVEEFFETDQECFNETGDLRRRAIINENGDLLIRFSALQYIRTIKSDWLYTYDGIEDRSYVEVSEDYSVVNLYIYDYMDIDDLQWWSDLESDFAVLFCKVSMMKVLKRVPDDQNQMELVMINGETGRVIDRKIYKFGEVPHFNIKG